ncbi:MAG: formylglycine-generating enzyme family protein [Clostridia bacterium]|nr:formylglycine-generating enzyme family protein [Clostridia bacterium]
MDTNIVNQYNLVKIPSGTFLMGDTFGDGFKQELPVHEVYTDSYFIGKYNVTVKEYFDFIQDSGDEFQEIWCDFIDPCFILNEGGKYKISEGAEHFPMVQVSFVGAVAYCNWCSKKNGLESVYDLETLEGDLTKNGFRLPTEAQWEYACGGPEGFKCFYGNEFDAELINFKGYSGSYKGRRASNKKIGGFGLDENSPVPVGTFPANGFGVHEMIGNVNEWCHDKYAIYKKDSEVNPWGASEGTFRVIRGGCFIDGKEKMRKSYRHAIHPHAKCMVDGFRIALPNLF